MPKLLRSLLGICAGAVLLQAAESVAVKVHNPAGNLTLRVVATERLRFRASSPQRATEASDVALTEQPGLITVRCQPSDGAQIDLEMEIPYGVDIEAETTQGAIDFSGFTYRADLKTETGAIRVSTPWDATQLELSADQKPQDFQVPPNLTLFTREENPDGTPAEEWRCLRLLGRANYYGTIRVRAGMPAQVVLQDMPIPEDSAVKMHWQAPEYLRSMFRAPERDRLRIEGPVPKWQPPPDGDRAEPAGQPRFSADVRMVTLTASVSDGHGHPITDLEADDFEVKEEGVPQTVKSVDIGAVPFNLVLLLDLSGSTLHDRMGMKEAARRLVGIARPQDRVAAYALVDSQFHVVSPLVTNRDRLLKKIQSILPVGGGSPIYDMIVLSYAQELARLPDERNALVVISDGIDNRFDSRGPGSRVSFYELKRAAAEMNTLIYPIFLSTEWEFSKKARTQFEELADVSGGRLFESSSIHDMEGVYAQIAEELRSVYTVGYYPRDQNFDGAWRSIRMRVNRPGARLRTRTGYFAH